MEKMEKSKKKLVMKGISLVLAGTMATAFLTGCGKKESNESNEPSALLADTVLENGVVVYIDDEPMLMTYQSSRPNGRDFSIGCIHYHYMDVVTGSYYHIPNPEAYLDRDFCSYTKECGVIVLPADTVVQSLTNKLTADEIKKAQEGNFTDADVITVQQRLVKEAK